MAMAVKPTVGRSPRHCRNKTRYRSSLAAADGLLRITEAKARGDLPTNEVDRLHPLSVYDCDHCGSWHFGHRWT